MVILKRIAYEKSGTFGELWQDDKYLCVTLEDPWNYNEVGNSCIPEGTYQCRSYSSAKFHNVWEIKDVPGRTAILMHAGNTIEDTSGCPLVGEKFGLINGKSAITGSVKTLNMLRSTLPSNFTLKVTSNV